MEKIVQQGILYDFYGELLTEHQRKIYESAVFEDLSLTELSEEYGITRQGVHDLIKRCTKTMQGYEDRLHMIRRFEAIKENAEQLQKLSKESADISDIEFRNKVNTISSNILEELNS